MLTSILVAAVCGSLIVRQVAGQTPELGPNYIGDEGKSPLPPSTTLDGKVVKLDEIGPMIYLHHSTARLDCADGKMAIQLMFNRSFDGIVYPNTGRQSPCAVHGNGKNSIAITLPLAGCGTEQGPSRVFQNNIHIRFHNILEHSDDEVVTVVCRYPPPIAPPPLAGLPFIAAPPPASIIRQPILSGTNIIMIICAILFLALLLLGLGFGYACLKRRRISLIKKVPPPSLPPSDLSQFSMPFDGLKIPRAHAISLIDDVTSSETLPSDYPSESPSEVEEVDMGRPLAVGMPNRAYVMTEELLNTTYTDKMVREEVDIHRQPHMMIRKPTQQELRTTEQQLSTMLTSTEVHDSTEIQRGRGNLVRHQAELHAPPPVFQSEFRVHQPASPAEAAESEAETAFTEPDLHAMPPAAAQLRHHASQHSVDDLIRSTVTDTRVYEDIERRRRAVKEYYARQQQAPPPGWDVEIRQYQPDRDMGDTSSSHWDDSSVGTEVPPLPGLHHAAAESRYTAETLEQRHAYSAQEAGRSSRAFKPPAPLPPPRPPGARYSSELHMVQQRRHQLQQLQEEEEVYRSSGGLEEPIRPTTREITPPKRLPPAMSVLIRVLEAPHQYDDRLSVLTEDERATLRQLITHEQTFRTMLTEARVVEDFERIRQDSRYSQLLSSYKWDVIFNVLAPPLIEPAPSEFSETTRPPSEVVDFSEMGESHAEPRTHRYRRRADQQPLPPVYEYDSSGRQLHHSRSAAGSTRSHVTTKSSYGGDVRSVTEEMVDFHRYPPSLADDAGSFTPPDARSVVRSTAEFSADEWSALPPAVGESGVMSQHGAASQRYYQSESVLVRSGATAAPSTVGDREELYSVAETDVDWQRR